MIVFATLGLTVLNNFDGSGNCDTEIDIGIKVSGIEGVEVKSLWVWGDVGVFWRGNKEGKMKVEDEAKENPIDKPKQTAFVLLVNQSLSDEFVSLRSILLKVEVRK